MATKTARKKATAPEPEELEDDMELDELEEDEVEDEAPKSKKAKNSVTFGASDLARYLTEKTGKEVKPRELRNLIRKMARDGSGRVTREISRDNRERYNWSGKDDPEVQAIIAAFEGGELEADKQAKLAALKERKAQQKADGTAKKTTKKKAAAVVEDDDDEELELDDE